MSKRKNTIIIICFILVILLGAGAAAYPLIASINNERTQSLVQTEYEEKLQQLDTSEIDAALAAAREYNKTISTVQIEDIDKIKAELPPYEDLLNLANNGIMGYIMIPAINIDLPIYHGTTGAAMEKGAGHMEGTSLPVGGIGTHAVISAHSGMASAKLFTDLDKLELGDMFFITVCNQKLAYEVDNIAVVEPTDIDLIRIDTQQDYVTLLTCTPYGVNTHRLLVRGHRVEMAEEAIAEVEEKAEPAASTWIEKYEQGILIGVAIFLGLLLIALLVYFTKRLKQRKDEKEK
ncbi:class C sortase [Hominenteromicrobium sp.]|uniref:class C sortase n=1 Tax=Hominenteromicrobium sp. TaxID=3073581 RepID=UPI00399386EF